MIYAVVQQADSKSLINFYGNEKEVKKLSEKFNKQKDMHPLQVLATENFIPSGTPGIFYK